MNSSSYISFSVPDIGEEEIAEVVATMRSGWLTTGEKTAQFEKEFREYTNARQSLAVSSCTAGLHLALTALRLKPGDEVITTPLTFCATITAILHAGATPVLADVDADGNLSPESARKRVTSKTRAIIPVHLGGLPCEMDGIWRLAEEYGLAVVEDAAHAVGACYHDVPIGASSAPSDVVAFSFYATKNLTTGEGGMVTTGSADLYEQMKTLALHGISKDAWNRYSREGNWFYDVLEPGFKYNLPDLLSGIGLQQLRRLESFIAARKRIADLYRELLADVDELELPRERAGRRHAWHLFAIRLNLEQINLDRAEFIESLRKRGIGASVHFIPVPLLSFFRPWAELPHNACPRALALYPRLVSLPMHSRLTEDEVRRVAAIVKQTLHNARRAKKSFAPCA
ncbi:MAG: DegT/DnrJ/EryC1/StrS aminotransferase family protein [Bryobacterales bacterium]|nr:DegT/DnrJ/EryC1/StrS aminotransferase family protein [Bryobacterales bacterium]